MAIHKGVKRRISPRPELVEGWGWRQKFERSDYYVSSGESEFEMNETALQEIYVSYD